MSIENITRWPSCKWNENVRIDFKEIGVNMMNWRELTVDSYNICHRGIKPSCFTSDSVS